MPLRGTPGFITASKAPKLINRGLFNPELATYFLTEKYLFQILFARTLERRAINGVHVGSSTISNMLPKIAKFPAPLYEEIRKKNLEAKQWNVDETSWRIYKKIGNKSGYNYWLRIFASNDAVYYLIEPSRSGEVLQKFFGEGIIGAVVADRYSAYKRLPDGILLAIAGVM